jgi:hypothetical protein
MVTVTVNVFNTKIIIYNSDNTLYQYASIGPTDQKMIWPLPYSCNIHKLDISQLVIWKRDLQNEMSYLFISDMQVVKLCLHQHSCKLIAIDTEWTLYYLIYIYNFPVSFLFPTTDLIKTLKRYYWHLLHTLPICMAAKPIGKYCGSLWMWFESSWCETF